MSETQERRRPLDIRPGETFEEWRQRWREVDRQRDNVYAALDSVRGRAYELELARAQYEVALEIARRAGAPSALISAATVSAREECAPRVTEVWQANGVLPNDIDEEVRADADA